MSDMQSQSFDVIAKEVTIALIQKSSLAIDDHLAPDIALMRMPLIREFASPR